MSGGVLSLLQLLALAASLFSVAIAAMVALAYPLARTRLARLPPAQRATVLRWLCIAPLAGGTLLVGLCLLPSILGLLWPPLDHCHAHDGHLHLCLTHPPAAFVGPLGWFIGAAFWGLVTAALVAVAQRRRPVARLLRELWHSAAYDPAVGAHLIASPRPFCAVVGLARQKIVLSTAVVASLPEPLLRTVLSHEAAHVHRRDAAWQHVAALLSVAHLPSIRDRLRADLALATERACDEHAAAVVGDRLQVARAILSVERLFRDGADVGAAAPGFGGSDVPARIAGLLETPVARRRAWGPRLAAIAIAAALLALTPASTLHHWTETALGFFTH